MINKIIKEKVNYPFSKENLVKKIYQNVALFEHEPDYSHPGIQTNIILKCKEIDYILNYAVMRCKELFYEGKNIEDINYAIYPWIYISRDETTTTGFHNHNMLAPKTIKSIKTNYTFTYYVQMPNNLKNNDGKLWFINKDDTQIAFLPEENELVIFPADVYHKPDTATSSTLDRIVIAANILFDLPILKEKKTLL